MQRFHFESCSTIPEYLKKTYHTLNKTQPQLMGYQQSCGILSAKERNKQSLLVYKVLHCNMS